MNQKKISDYIHVGPNISQEHSELLLKDSVTQLLQQAESVTRSHIEKFADSEQTQKGLDLLSGIFALRGLPEERKSLIAFHPIFQYWLKGMRRTQHKSFANKAYEFIYAIPDFVWPEEVRLCLSDRTWRVRTDYLGGLRCPSLSRFIELGSLYSFQDVSLVLEDEKVILHCQDSLRIEIPRIDITGEIELPLPTIDKHGYEVTIHQTVADGEIEVFNRDRWLRGTFTGTNQRSDGVEFFGWSDDLYPDQFEINEFDIALNLLKKNWPECYYDVKRFTRVIVPLKSEEGIRRAFTVSSRQGAIFLDATEPNDMVENIIHENAHVKLRCIQSFDGLLVDPDDDSVRVPVAWRPDPRPMPGIIEGVYVFSHVAEYEWRRSNTAGEKPSQHYKEMVNNIINGMQALREHAKLTEMGNYFLEQMDDWVTYLHSRC